MRVRHRRCKVCGAPGSPEAPISSRGKCGPCGHEAMVTALRQLAAGEGEVAERCRQRSTEGLKRYVAELDAAG